MLKNNLNIRFKKFKDSIINNKYKFGKYWEKEKITFEVDFKDGLFNSKGSRDYLPKIFDESIIHDEIIPINGKKFVQLGERKLCTLKKSGSYHLLHLSHYFHEIKKIIKDNDICLDVGSGSGLLQFIIHQNKKTTNIFIDLPESIQSSIALCFTLFPDSKIILPNEINGEEYLNIKDYDFIFLFPNQKHLIKNSSVNFCVNTRSFMEMDIDEVNDYIKYFNNILKTEGYCLISNRVVKRTYFFSYNFKKTSFKKIYLKKDNYYYSKENYRESSVLNLLLKKKEGSHFSFNLFNFIFGIFYLKPWEFFFWNKYFLKKTIFFPLVLIKKFLLTNKHN
ncbi:putative sugar O-methyltransferase [Candidatus Pelagibacter sp. Uisw_137]|uniref:putative sugar O-methyltransferase n=1 Tax=Candidatus Pelagibacter sp. Uisw_137 TaxID=3230992 RepID=UPI0039E8A8E4